MVINSNSFIKTKAIKTIIVDLCLLTFIYYVPTLAHAFRAPIYMFEPMRVALFMAVLLLRDRRNAFLLAITLPLFSFMVSGHPIAVKNLIMSIELFVNIFLLYKLIDLRVGQMLSCFISILVSKVVYYGMKILAINVGLLAAKTIDTPIYIQLFVAVFLSILFVFINNKNING